MAHEPLGVLLSLPPSSPLGMLESLMCATTSSLPNVSLEDQSSGSYAFVARTSHTEPFSTRCKWKWTTEEFKYTSENTAKPEMLNYIYSDLYEQYKEVEGILSWARVSSWIVKYAFSHSLVFLFLFFHPSSQGGEVSLVSVWISLGHSNKLSQCLIPQRISMVKE